MRYKESVDLIKEIESKYDVMSITIQGVSLWPVIRLNIVDILSGRGSYMRGGFVQSAMLVLKTLCYYNPFSMFRKSSIWLFTSFDRRKLLNNELVCRVSGGILESFNDVLVIEKPAHNQLFSLKKNIKEKCIISESWLLLLVHVLSYFLKFKKFKIENYDLLIKILETYKVQYNFSNTIRLLFAQRIVIDVLLYIIKKPKVVVIECPYTVMGYLWAFHKHNIKVIEMQHGVINRQHYAYNSEYHSRYLYPDAICVFGEVEYNFFKSDGINYCNDIYKTGLYYLNYILHKSNNDPFKSLRNKFNRVVLVSGQKGHELDLSSFINNVSRICKDIVFIYVPRTEEEMGDYVFNELNVIIKTNVNIYEYMKWSDIHCTISSTTCLESQFFHKPTFFYDFNNIAYDYYGDILTKNNGAFYIKTPELFKQALIELDNKDICYRDLFSSDSVEMIKGVISDEINLF